MQNYEAMLNNRKGKTPVNIQAIYDVVYAPEISANTLMNFSLAIESMDRAVIADGTRALVKFKPLGKDEAIEIPLSELDPQLREVMVVCFRLTHKARGNDLANDYVHLGIMGHRLYGETNLTVPGSGRRAGDLAELAVAIREKIKLY